MYFIINYAALQDYIYLRFLYFISLLSQLTVMPVKTGIQRRLIRRGWITASAGMTLNEFESQKAIVVGLCCQIWTGLHLINKNKGLQPQFYYSEDIALI